MVYRKKTITKDRTLSCGKIIKRSIIFYKHFKYKLKKCHFNKKRPLIDIITNLIKYSVSGFENRSDSNSWNAATLAQESTWTQEFHVLFSESSVLLNGSSLCRSRSPNRRIKPMLMLNLKPCFFQHVFLVRAGSAFGLGQLQL